jgi:hypothetical protein
MGNARRSQWRRVHRTQRLRDRPCLDDVAIGHIDISAG